MLLIAENCGRFGHLAPVPECPYFPDVGKAIRCTHSVRSSFMGFDPEAQNKRISIAISKTILRMLFVHGRRW